MIRILYKAEIMATTHYKFINGIRGRIKQIQRESTQIAKRIIQRLGFVIPPLRISLDVTDSCNFRCPTCSKWQAGDAGKELNLEEWNYVFKKIHKFPLFREISIGGGEPFVRSDIFEILILAKQAGFHVDVITNGGLLDDAVLRKLEKIRVDSMMLSLNSLRPAIHDQSRGMPGSHERILQFIDKWRAQPRIVRLCLSTIIMESNCDELSSIAGYVHENGLNGILFQALLPTEVHYAFAKKSRMPEPDTVWHLNHPFWVKRTEILDRQIEELIQLQRKGYPILNPPSQLKDITRYFGAVKGASETPCLGTLHRMHIDPTGNMRLCYGFPPIGNILKDEPRQMWKSKSAREIRRDGRKCTRPCRMLNCNL